MKRTNKRLFSILLMISIIFALNPASDRVVAKSKTRLNKSSLVLREGESSRLYVKNNKSRVKWSSSDKKTASVSGKGIVRAKRKGTADITAKVKGKKYICRVTVKKKTGSGTNNNTNNNIGSSNTGIVMTIVTSKTSECTTPIPPVSDEPVNAPQTTDSPANAPQTTDSPANTPQTTDSPANTPQTTDDPANAPQTSDSPANTPQTSDSPENTPSASPSADSDSYIKQVLEIVNAERAKEGANPLVLDDALCNAAAVRANEITELFAHERPDGTSCFTILDSFGISYMACGENIAAGQRSPQEVMQAWMDSPGHRANILNPRYGKLGVGFVLTDYGYKYYWVQMFTD